MKKEQIKRNANWEKGVVVCLFTLIALYGLSEYLGSRDGGSESSGKVDPAALQAGRPAFKAIDSVSKSALYD